MNDDSNNRYQGEFCNNRRLTKRICLEIPNVKSIIQMLSIPVDNGGCRLLGLIVRVDFDYLYINHTGKNGSINDWHKILSTDDFIIIKVLRELYSIDNLIDIKVELVLDNIVHFSNIIEKDVNELDLVEKPVIDENYHIAIPSKIARYGYCIG